MGAGARPGWWDSAQTDPGLNTAGQSIFSAWESRRAISSHSDRADRRNCSKGSEKSSIEHLKSIRKSWRTSSRSSRLGGRRQGLASQRVELGKDFCLGNLSRLDQEGWGQQQSRAPPVRLHFGRGVFATSRVDHHSTAFARRIDDGCAGAVSIRGALQAGPVPPQGCRKIGGIRAGFRQSLEAHPERITWRDQGGSELFFGGFFFFSPPGGAAPAGNLEPLLPGFKNAGPRARVWGRSAWTNRLTLADGPAAPPVAWR